jgi:hypothetical protein
MTATECVAAGLPPVEFGVDITGTPFVVESRLESDCYLLLVQPGDRARLHCTPCFARGLQDFCSRVLEQISHRGGVVAGQSTEYFLGGSKRMIFGALTGTSLDRFSHAGVLVVDPQYCPRGMLCLFSVAVSGDVSSPMRPEEIMGMPEFASLVQSFRVGVHQRFSSRPPPSYESRAVVSSVSIPARSHDVTQLAGSPGALAQEAVGASTSAVSEAPSSNDNTLPSQTNIMPAEIEYVDNGERVRIRLGERTTFGRARDNTVVLTDSMSSKHHCAVEWDGTHFVLIDRGSINGTRLNERLIRTPTVLEHNAKIELARVSMRFRELSHSHTNNLHLLIDAFEREGIPLPHVPTALAGKIQRLAPWFYSTETLPSPPLNGDLGVAIGAHDYLVIHLGSSGSAPSVLQYCLGYGPLRLALACTFDRSMTDKTLAQHLIRTSFHGVRALVGAVQQTVRHQLWPAQTVLDVRAIQGLYASWSPVGGGFARQTQSQSLASPPETLADALTWVQGL